MTIDHEVDDIGRDFYPTFHERGRVEATLCSRDSRDQCIDTRKTRSVGVNLKTIALLSTV